MKLFKIILPLCIVIILTIVNKGYTNSIIYVNVDGAAAPYLGFTSEQIPQGFINDLLISLLGENDQPVYVQDSIYDDQSNLVYGFITRDKVVDGYHFVELPHRLHYYVFMRKGANILSLNDLLNKRIIVVKNDLPYQLLYENKASQILKVKSYDEALVMLASGINDCAILPYQIATEIIENKKLKNIEYIATPFLSFDFGLAIPENKTELINTIESGLKELIKNNDYKKIDENWFVIEGAPKTADSSNHKVIFIIIGVLILIILALVGFVKMLLHEMDASTNDYVSELSQAKLAPLAFDLNNPIISKILALAPAWLFVNDIEGKIHHISQDLLLDFLGIEHAPDDFKVSDLFSEELTQKLSNFDHRIDDHNANLITDRIQFNLGGEKINKWLLKYPMRFQGSNQVMFLNVFIKPIMGGDYGLRLLSPEYIFSSVLDSLPDLIFIKNNKGVYLGGNKAFFSFCGKSEDEIIGKNDLEIFGVEKSENYAKTDKIVLEAGIVWEGLHWDSLPTGESVRFENVKIPLTNKKKEIFALVGISHDVTRHHKYEQELASAKEKAEESDRIKSSFLANMSHEIRTPMNSIIGFSDLLADPDLTIDQRIEIIDMIQSNGHTLIDLIDDIIDFSRIEAGQIHLKFNEFNLNTIISDAYTYALSKRNQLGKEHMNIAFDLGSIEDSFMIYSDPFRLRQVLKNLINSSIRFSTSESVFIGYVVRNEELIMYIKNDNNIVSEELISKLLSRSAENTYSFSDIEESAGIALIIAKNVIEMIEGQLFFEELKPGRTDFYFAIPLKKANIKEPKMKDSVQQDIPNWEGKVILVAEDEETNFLLLDGVLSKTKAEIIRAVNGKQAIELFRANANRIHIVLMDIRMPEVNGAEASRKILETHPDAIIIAQTAYAMPEDKEQYLKLGMKAVLAKPIDPGELYYVCHKFLSKF